MAELSRGARTVRALVTMSLVGASLIGYNAWSSARDLSLATGPRSDAQRAFLVVAADRPDIADFFKRLKPPQRLAMAEAVGRYQDPKLAKLIGTLLADFDAQARAKLGEALNRLAPVAPKEVAQELSKKGSFQSLAVSTALKGAGEKALPFVVEMLANADARPNAVAFLVEAGSSSIPLLLPKLQDESKDIRLAAADALGKLRAREASAPLRAKLTGPEDERAAYFAALASIGDPTTEPLLTDVLKDETSPGGERAQAMVGLGRIATPSAIGTLWSFVSDDDLALAANARGALASVGPAALAHPQAKDHPQARLLVAAQIPGTQANAIIVEGLMRGLAPAFDAAATRPDLIQPLTTALDDAVAQGRGEAALFAARALERSERGRAILDQRASNPRYDGLRLRS